MLPKDIMNKDWLYPSGMKADTLTFRREMAKDICRWVECDALNILFIYGILNLYAARRVNIKKNASCSLIVSTVQGSDCRISDFDWGTRNYLQDLIVSDYRDFRLSSPGK